MQTNYELQHPMSNSQTQNALIAGSALDGLRISTDAHSSVFDARQTGEAAASGDSCFLQSRGENYRDRKVTKGVFGPANQRSQTIFDPPYVAKRLKPLKPRPHHVSGVQDYLNPSLLNIQGTLSKPLRPAVRHLSPATKQRIANEIKSRDLTSEPDFWSTDNEMQPTGKDPRHDRASTLKSRYYSTAERGEQIKPFEDAVEETKQQLYIISNFNHHTSKHSEVNKSLSHFLRLWTYTGRICNYSHIRRLHSDGKPFEQPTGPHDRRRRILLTVMAVEYNTIDPVFSSLCSNALSVGHMHRFKGAVDGLSEMAVDSLCESLKKKMGGFASDFKSVAETTISTVRGNGFISSIVDGIIEVYAKLKSYFTTFAEYLVDLVKPLTVSIILMVVFLSITAYFTSMAVIEAFSQNAFGTSPMEACINEVLPSFDFSSPQEGQTWFKSNTADHINGLGRLVNSCRSILQALAAVWDVFLDCVDKAYVHFTGKPFTTRAKDAQDAATYYNSLIDVCSKFEADPDAPDNAANAVTAYKELLVNHKKTAFIPTIGAAVTSAINRYQPVYNKALGVLKTTGARPPSCVIFLRGVPGAGKSAMISALTDRLSKVLGVPNTAYFRNFAQAHWDGYRGQTFTVFDDFLLSSDPAVRSLECDNVIHASNTSPFPLQMASLEDKDNTFFTSRFLILTSNASADFSNCALTDPGAVSRRITYDIKFSKPLDNDLLKISLSAALVQSKAAVYRNKGFNPQGALVFGLIKRDCGPIDIIDYICKDYKETTIHSPLTYEQLVAAASPPPPLNPSASEFVPQAFLDGLIPQQGEMHRVGQEKPEQREYTRVGAGATTGLVKTPVCTPGFCENPDVSLQEGEIPVHYENVKDDSYFGKPSPTIHHEYYSRLNGTTVLDKFHNLINNDESGRARLSLTSESFLGSTTHVPNHSKSPLGGPIRKDNGAPDLHNMSTHMDIATITQRAWSAFVTGDDLAASIAKSSYEYNPKIMCDFETARIYFDKRGDHTILTENLKLSDLSNNGKHPDILEGAIMKPITSMNYADAHLEFQLAHYRLLICTLPQPTDPTTFHKLAVALGRRLPPFDPSYYKIPTMTECIDKPMFPLVITTRYSTYISLTPAPVLEFWRRIWNMGFLGVDNDSNPLVPASVFGNLMPGVSQLYLQICAGNYDGKNVAPDYCFSDQNSFHYHTVRAYYDQNVRIRGWRDYALQVTIVASLVAAAITIAIAAYSFFSKGDESAPTTEAVADAMMGQSWPDNKTMDKKLTRPSRRERRQKLNEEKAKSVSTRHTPIPQSAFNDMVSSRLTMHGQHFDYSKAALYAASVRRIEFHSTGGCQSFQHVLGITGGTCITLLHGIKCAEKAGYSIHLMLGPNNRFKTTFESLRKNNAILEDPSRDFAFITFPHSFSRNLIKHFPDSTDSSLTDLVRVGFARNDETKYLYEAAQCIYTPSADYTVEGKQVEVSSNYRFNLPGAAGMCSTPYLSAKTGCIVALHAAGNSVYSTCITITKSEVQSFVLKLRDQVSEDYRQYVTPKSPLPKELKAEGQFSPDPFYQGAIQIAGTINRKHFSPTKTNFMPSALHGVFGQPEGKPAHLYKTPDGTPVFARWCEKNKGKSCRDAYEGMTFSRNWDGVFAPKTHGLTYKSYTFDQVVDGCDDLPPLDRKHSPGYPWVLEGLNREQVLTCHRARLRAQVEAIHARVMKGKIPRTLYTLIPKDEIRPNEKVDSGDTRFVQVAELAFLIYNKMYFGWFLNLHSTHFLDTDIMVGINPYGLDWDVLARRLCLAFCLDKDISKWDIHYPIRMAMQFPDQAGIRYKEVPVMILRLICMATFYTNVLYMNLIFEYTGMPSGDLKTAHLNSAVNSASNRSVYNEQPQRYALGVLGDDLASSHEEGFDHEKANDTLIERFGWTITDATKGGKPYAKDLEEIQFLKRGFSFDGGRWLGPLDRSSITKMLTWVQASSAQEAVKKTFDNWEIAVRELSLHDEHLFHVFQKVVLSALEEDVHSNKPIARSHEEMRQATANTSIRY